MHRKAASCVRRLLVQIGECRVVLTRLCAVGEVISDYWIGYKLVKAKESDGRVQRWQQLEPDQPN